MATGTTTKKAASVSTEAVRDNTGRGWQQWFEILYAAGAKGMNHTEIAGYLRREHQVSPWWSQMVANDYEQDRGLREKHQMP